MLQAIDTLPSVRELPSCETIFTSDQVMKKSRFVG
jgi:hypothetical protein